MTKPIRFLAAGFVLAAALTSVRPSAAQTVTGLAPLLQLDSTGITQSTLDVFFCCIVKSPLYQARQATVFTDRSTLSGELWT